MVFVCHKIIIDWYKHQQLGLPDGGPPEQTLQGPNSRCMVSFVMKLQLTGTNTGIWICPMGAPGADPRGPQYQNVRVMCGSFIK